MPLKSHNHNHPAITNTLVHIRLAGECRTLHMLHRLRKRQDFRERKTPPVSRHPVELRAPKVGEQLWRCAEVYRCFQSISQSIYLSIHLSIYLSIYMYVCVHVCMLEIYAAVLKEACRMPIMRIQESACIQNDMHRPHSYLSRPDT